MENRKNTIVGSLILIFVGFLWGLYHIVARNSLDSLTVRQFQFYEYVGASLCMLLVMHKSLKNANKSMIIHGLILGIVVFVGQMFQTYANIFTTIGKVTFITVMYVITVPVIATLFMKKKTSRNVWIAVVLSVVGLFLLTQATGGINIGDIMAFIGCACFTIQIFLNDKWLETDDAKVLIIFQLIGSAICATIALLIAGDSPVLPPIGLSGYLSLAYVIFLSIALGFYLQLVGQNKLSPQLSSILLTLEAPFATVLAAIFLGEPITLMSGIGCLLMLAAMIIAQF